MNSKPCGTCLLFYLSLSRHLGRHTPSDISLSNIISFLIDPCLRVYIFFFEAVTSLTSPGFGPGQAISSLSESLLNTHLKKRNRRNSSTPACTMSSSRLPPILYKDEPSALRSLQDRRAGQMEVPAPSITDYAVSSVIPKSMDLRGFDPAGPPLSSSEDYRRASSISNTASTPPGPQLDLGEVKHGRASHQTRKSVRKPSQRPALSYVTIS